MIYDGKRPTGYDQAILDNIINRIQSKEELDKILAPIDMPTFSSLLKWVELTESDEWGWISGCFPTSIPGGPKVDEALDKINKIEKLIRSYSGYKNYHVLYEYDEGVSMLLNKRLQCNQDLDAIIAGGQGLYPPMEKLAQWCRREDYLDDTVQAFFYENQKYGEKYPWFCYEGLENKSYTDHMLQTVREVCVALSMHGGNIDYPGAGMMICEMYKTILK